MGKSSSHVASSEFTPSETAKCRELFGQHGRRAKTTMEVTCLSLLILRHRLVAREAHRRPKCSHEHVCLRAWRTLSSCPLLLPWACITLPPFTGCDGEGHEPYWHFNGDSFGVPGRSTESLLVLFVFSCWCSSRVCIFLSCFYHLNHD